MIVKHVAIEKSSEGNGVRETEMGRAAESGISEGLFASGSGIGGRMLGTEVAVRGYAMHVVPWSANR